MRRRVWLGPGVLRLLSGTVLMLLTVPALGAQQPDQLLRAAQQLAGAWAGGVDQSVVARLAPDGVSLHLEGVVSAKLPARHARAAVREYLRAHQPGEASIARVSLVDGSGERGFVELAWITRKAGTSQTLRRTVFMGLRRGDTRWMVDEIRVLP